MVNNRKKSETHTFIFLNRCAKMRKLDKFVKKCEETQETQAQPNKTKIDMAAVQKTLMIYIYKD
jgi:hypothetical protein